MASRKIFNANTQQEEEATLSVDKDNEIVAAFADGSIVKFPAGLSEEQFTALIATHKEQNEGNEVITPAMEAQKIEERAASEALIETTPDEQPVDTPTEKGQSNEPTDTELPV